MGFQGLVVYLIFGTVRGMAPFGMPQIVGMTMVIFQRG
jgi:hypothetical protein